MFALYLLTMGRDARRSMLREMFQAHVQQRPELMKAVRESLPDSVGPAFDELIAQLRAADWSKP